MEQIGGDVAGGEEQLVDDCRLRGQGLRPPRLFEIQIFLRFHIQAEPVDRQGCAAHTVAREQIIIPGNRAFLCSCKEIVQVWVSAGRPMEGQFDSQSLLYGKITHINGVANAVAVRIAHLKFNILHIIPVKHSNGLVKCGIVRQIIQYIPVLIRLHRQVSRLCFNTGGVPRFYRRFVVLAGNSGWQQACTQEQGYHTSHYFFHFVSFLSVLRRPVLIFSGKAVWTLKSSQGLFSPPPNPFCGLIKFPSDRRMTDRMLYWRPFRGKAVWHRHRSRSSADR